MMSANQHNNTISSRHSGQSLATFFIAWVSAATIASVFLRWQYMWIALAVLTVVFSIACGYLACTHNRQTQGQIIRENEINIQQQGRNIQSVCGDMGNSNNNYSEIIQPPPYWVTDSPPCYDVATGMTERSTPSMAISSTEEIQSRTHERRLSSPPLYSRDIQPNHTIIDSTFLPQTIVDHHHCHFCSEHEVGIPTNMLTISGTSAFVSQISTPSNHAKDESTINKSLLQQIDTSSGTHCLSNFISNTTSRGPEGQLGGNSMRNISIEEHVSQCIGYQETPICTNDRMNNNTQ